MDEATIKIFSGPSTNFDQSIIIGLNNPNLLWNLFHSLMGIPLPKIIDPKKIIKEYLEKEAVNKSRESEPEKIQQEVITKSKEPEPEKLPQTDLEKELSALNAAGIVTKVLNEKGIQITNSLKSKAAILRKALKIYKK
jgi:hypothetical protein